MTKPIRVLIADDHPVVRQGLAMMFAAEHDIEIVGEATNGAEVVQLARRHSPDVVVLDLMMPETDGLTAMQQIQNLTPMPQVLVLTSFTDDHYITTALQSGVNGFYLKDSEPEALVAAVRTVHGHGNAIHPKILEQMMNSYQQPADQSPLTILTAREIQVLRLLGQGLSNQTIAGQIHVSKRTVTTHVRNILDKLDLDNRTQAALYARDQQIV